MFCNGFLKCFQVFLQVFQKHDLSVSSIFQPDDANVPYGCFKSKPDVAHDAMGAPATATYCSYVRSGGGLERSPRMVWRRGPRVGA